MPGAVARPLGNLVGGLWRALGLKGTPPIHGFPVAMMSRHVTVNTDKARRELGYTPILSREQGLAAL
jgi:nucleoside-diphosphate-sugar epimerase